MNRLAFSAIVIGFSLGLFFNANAKSTEQIVSKELCQQILNGESIRNYSTNILSEKQVINIVDLYVGKTVGDVENHVLELLSADNYLNNIENREFNLELILGIKILQFQKLLGESTRSRTDTELFDEGGESVRSDAPPFPKAENND